MSTGAGQQSTGAEIDRMFDRFRGGVVDENSSNPWMPVVDIIERENDFYINR